MPAKMGNFTRIVPGEYSDKLQAIIEKDNPRKATAMATFDH